MMIYKIEEFLIDLFLKGPRDSKHMSAINVCMLNILQQPYFEGGYNNHQLFQHSDEYYSLQYTFANKPPKSADPLNNIYSNGYEEEDDIIERPKSTHPEKQVCAADVHSDIIMLAEQYVQDFRSSFPLAQLIFEPTAQDMQKRHTLTLEHVTYDGVLDMMRGVLGPHYYYAVLNRENISYHDHSYSNNYFEYIVAHNEHEIAGVLGYTPQDNSNGLSYVSVSPAFQRRGLSQQMYQQFIDQSMKERKYIVRSSPSVFTMERPNITRSYDAMLKSCDVLHVTSGTYMEGALQELLGKHDYDQVLAQAKPLCDQVAQMKRQAASSYEAEEHDRCVAQQLRLLFDFGASKKMKV